MFVDLFIERFQQAGAAPALIWRDREFSYAWLLDALQRWTSEIRALQLKPSSVVALEADFSPNSVALFLALADLGMVVVPLTSSVRNKRAEFLEIAQAEAVLSLDDADQLRCERIAEGAAIHAIYQTLTDRRHPGLVLFSSGSTGKSKAAVHDLVPLLKKFEVRRHAYRAISFLLYDHIGGINTMLYSLSNGGCMVTVRERTPDEVLDSVACHKVELLPTSPTFLNLILISEAYKRYDLSSLKLVTYGTEPMPESTLRRFHELFPQINLLQTYGLSELGILRSKSKSSDSLWVKIGGEGFETRIVDGVLQIKAQSAMLGYLNAPSPFTDDGWFNTQDRVEVEGEYMRILGRESEIINVGGEKVYPAEVESVIQECDNVADAVVYKEKNPIIGNIVCARVTLHRPEDRVQFVARLKQFCAARLQRYKVPTRVVLVDGLQHSARFKRIRNEAGGAVPAGQE